MTTLNEAPHRRMPASRFSYYLIAALSITIAQSFVVVRPAHHHHHATGTLLLAKRSRKQQEDDDMNRWYDEVKKDATPNDVFWEETERQRLLNQLGSGEDFVGNIGGGGGGGTMASQGSMAASFEGFQSTLKSSPTASPQPTLEMQVEAQKTERNTESTLMEYSRFAVSDNWISDANVALYGSDNYEDGVGGRLGDRELQDRLIEEELLAMNDDDDDENPTVAQLEAKIKGFNDAWMEDAEPWDIYGQPRGETDNPAIQVKSDPDNEFLYTDADPIENERLEQDLMDRLADCQIASNRLEKARVSPKADAFFQREPDAIQGYDRMWVCAIDRACYSNLAGVFRNYGIQFADNFGDFEDGCAEDGLYSIEDIASYKARKVFEVTGLPVLTMRTGFEVEPVAPTGAVPERTSTPLVNSGYRFNNIGVHVDHIIEALKPVSDNKRVTRYRTCLCYYDGEMELYEYSTLDCDIYWATSLRTFIPVNQAINQISKTLQLTFGLEYMAWLKTSQSEASSRFGTAVTQLRDRVLKDGRVLPNDIIDVSAFMDSMVDVNLMDDCAKNLAQRFMDLKPTKILTVATTGLVIAMPMAKYLQVPVVYARKERNVVMADTYKATYNSNTVGKNRELLVSKKHIDPEDRVLIVDDFLSSGASQDALLRIVADAGAESVGVGVLLEKIYDSGRLSLSGFDVVVESLCGVASVKGGVIQLLEEDGFDQM